MFRTSLTKFVKKPSTSNPLNSQFETSGSVPTPPFIATEPNQLLPASYESDHNLLLVPRLEAEFFAIELDMVRLENSFVRKWFWTVAHRGLPRPLHRQLVLNRAVVVAEQIDLHLVWGAGGLFLKPIPRFLLDPQVWTKHLNCCGTCDTCKASEKPCPKHYARRHALGFLFSYVALVRHESDFLLAKQYLLLPQEVQWCGWRKLCCELLTLQDRSDLVAERWEYGELRLSRLNKMYWFIDGRLPRAYLPRWNQYGKFWLDNIAWVAPTTAYVVVALTAFQTGLATDAVSANAAFQAVAYGLTIFSLVALPGSLVLISLYFIVVFVQNAVWARSQVQAKGGRKGYRPP